MMRRCLVGLVSAALAIAADCKPHVGWWHRYDLTDVNLKTSGQAGYPTPALARCAQSDADADGIITTACFSVCGAAINMSMLGAGWIGSPCDDGRTAVCVMRGAWDAPPLVASAWRVYGGIGDAELDATQPDSPVLVYRGGAASRETRITIECRRDAAFAAYGVQLDGEQLRIAASGDAGCLRLNGDSVTAAIALSLAALIIVVTSASLFGLALYRRRRARNGVHHQLIEMRDCDDHGTQQHEASLVR